MDKIYTEEIKSTGTSLLFLCLSALFFTLFAWRISVVGFRFFPGLWGFLGLVFAFYVFNYRILKISISTDVLKLRFGIVSWKTRLDNIRAISLDNSPAIVKFGGAGVHFTFVLGRYRVFFNFLEYPRIMVTLIKKQGLVQDLVFTTCQPGLILEIIQSRMIQT